VTESIVDLMSQGRDSTARASKIYGLVVGIVTNIQDPEKLGRIKVKFPWLHDSVESWWARIAYPMAGKERGYWWIPEVEDEVLVGFDHGDVRFPYVVGALHNGVDKPPKCDDVTSTFGGPEYAYGGYSCSGRDFNEDGKNDLRFIRSRSGHLLIFDDKDGQEKITLTDKTGAHRIEIFTDKKKVVITSADGDIELCASKTVKITCDELNVHTRKDTIYKVDGDWKNTITGDFKSDVTGSISKKASQSATYESSMDTTIKAGTSLKGQSPQTTITGDAQIKCHGAMAEYSADAMCVVKGGIVAIN
jgi:hypothetical protein